MINFHKYTGEIIMKTINLALASFILVLFTACGGSSSNTLDNNTTDTDFTSLLNSADLPEALKTSLSSEVAELDDTTIEHLTYMGNEERLAYDVYNALYTLYPDVNQFTNIATKSESQHIKTIQLVIKKYDIKDTELSYIQEPLDYMDIPLENMEAGKYDIPAIQALYDALYDKGEDTEIDAIEVGCMVEVTDINDLDKALLDAQNIDAPDVTAAFEFLLEGSYFHYWAFDSALKSRGITEGCCSLGIIDGIDYCHPEYPTNENQGNEGSQQGNN